MQEGFPRFSLWQFGPANRLVQLGLVVFVVCRLDGWDCTFHPRVKLLEGDVKTDGPVFGGFEDQLWGPSTVSFLVG